MTRHGVHQSVVTKKVLGRWLGRHGLRRSKAMEMLSRGDSVKKVSSCLGHSDVAGFMYMEAEFWGGSGVEDLGCGINFGFCWDKHENFNMLLVFSFTMSGLGR